LSPTDTYTSTPGLLDDWQELDDFARDEVKRHPKTVKRWTQQPDGLPFAYLGKTPIIHVPTARDWLLGKLRRPNPRRA
jgi:hypothetical protein